MIILICAEISIRENHYLDHLIRTLGNMFCLVFFAMVESGGRRRGEGRLGKRRVVGGGEGGSAGRAERGCGEVAEGGRGGWGWGWR